MSARHFLVGLSLGIMTSGASWVLTHSDALSVIASGAVMLGYWAVKTTS